MHILKIIQRESELMAKWMIAAKKADFDAIARQFHISPITASSPPEAAVRTRSRS